MKKTVDKMEPENTLYAAKTMLNLKQMGTPGHTGPPDTHYNHTGLPRFNSHS